MNLPRRDRSPRRALSLTGRRQMMRWAVLSLALHLLLKRLGERHLFDLYFGQDGVYDFRAAFRPDLLGFPSDNGLAFCFCGIKETGRCDTAGQDNTTVGYLGLCKHLSNTE
mgnify:CR=1 FL=1